LTRITAALSEAVTPERVFEALVDQAAAAVDATGAALWMVDDDLRVVRLVHSTAGGQAARRKHGEDPLDEAARMPVLECIRRTESVWVSSSEALVVALPVVVQGRALGALEFSWRSQPRAVDDVRSFLELVAQYGAQALERLRLLEAEKRARRSAEMLYDLARRVIAAGKLEDVLDAALETLGHALGTSRSAILVYDEGDVMRFRAWRGLSEKYRRAVEGHCPWPRDALAPEPIIVPDVEQDAAVAAFLPLFREERIGALGFIPLVASERLIGKFMIYYDAPRRPSAEDLGVAKAIADHVAAAIARFIAIAELERAVRFHEMFTAILGHDLRNPLAGILAAAQVAQRRTQDERVGNIVGRIVSSGERMSRMIDQLLDFTRVRVGKGLPLEPAPGDLLPLLRQVLEELGMAHAGCKFHVEHAGDLAGVWDHDRLSQVFSNLVGNAIQHGDAEHGVSVRADGGRPDAVCVHIHNMGVVAPELLPKLFDPMTGGERRGEKAHGLGLGLFISQQIARAHGGEITVVSSAESGTRFTVSLPRSPRVERG
jgi:signal transduction histidine kinase